jgi:hypothetical protein
MKRYATFLLTAGLFVLASALLYSVHYLIFRDSHHIWIYLVGDLAFLPIEVFLVVIVIERVIESRAKREKLKKLNVVVGAFFSEVGTRLLGDLLPCLKSEEEIRRHLDVSVDWSPKEFKEAFKYARTIGGETDCTSIDLNGLRAFLVQKRPFLLSLLENPGLLEHDRFTDLLWSIFHVDEELEARPSVVNLPQSDLAHISGDVRRVYTQLAAEWIDYAEHLKYDYPFLFSLVSRTHPLQAKPSPTVSG